MEQYNIQISGEFIDPQLIIEINNSIDIPIINHYRNSDNKGITPLIFHAG